MKQVTTVLSVVNRLEYFDSQIDAIESQTIDSDIFVIWRNAAEYTRSYPSIIYKNETQHFNSLYGRFYNSLHIKTPYTFIVDDDILPGQKYIEKCIDFSKKHNDEVVIATMGINFKTNTTSYDPRERISPDVFLKEPKKVDMGGQGWFMKTQHLQHFLYDSIFNENSGEDLHYSYCLFKNKVPIYILDKDVSIPEGWQDLTLGERGKDNRAQWKQTQHLEIRNKVLKHYTTKGWLSGRGNSTLI